MRKNVLRKITYGDKFAISNEDDLKTITFEQVNRFDFKRNIFNEFIIRQPFVHLYFDFDQIKTVREYDEVRVWLDDISEVFGKYSVGGYCNNKEMAEHGFRLIKDNSHFLSMHVVFYETMIKTSDLNTIMKDHVVHKLCDRSVYGGAKRQVFRHVLSDKFVRPGDSKNCENHGTILDWKKPSTQIVQIRGDEPLINQNEWEEVFPKMSEVEKILNTKVFGVDPDYVDVEDPEEPQANEQSESSERSEADPDIDWDDVEVVTLPPMTRELFDVIVKGFDKSITIHNDCSRPLDQEVSIFPIVAGLQTCINKEISRDDVNIALDYIHDHATLTPKARDKWFEQIYRNQNSKAKHYGALIKIIRRWNPMYYDQNVARFFWDIRDLFTKSDRVMEDLLFDADKIKSVTSLLQELGKCLAINTKGGYIVKRRDSITNEIVYVVMDEKDVKKYIGSLQFTWKDPEQAQKQKTQHKKITEEKSIKLFSLINNTKYWRAFARYKGAEILSNNPDIFTLYRPPSTTFHDEKLIIDWMDFMKSRVKYEKPFLELIDSHAYRFRNPMTFIEKFFINYGKGHNGKSFLVFCLSLMYPGFENSAIQQEQIESDQFNSWITKNLFLWMEEAQNSNYRSKNIQQRVKQLTTKKTSSRGMYKESTTARNWAIIGMNTNQEDLYGLVRGDQALIERLVILDFKDCDDRYYIDKKCAEFANNPNFGYSLYHYIRYIHQINPSFSPVRYFGEEKEKFINHAKMMNRNSVEDWLAERINENVDTYTSRNIQYVYFQETSANESYRYYKRANESRLCLVSIKETMLSLGFEYIKTTIDDEQMRVYRMKQEKYDELVQKLNPIVEE